MNSAVWVSDGIFIILMILISESSLRNVLSSGFSITPEELYNRISEFVASSHFVGWDQLNAAISGAKGLRELRWASPVELKTTVEKVFTEKFGAKEAAKPKSKVSGMGVCLTTVRVLWLISSTLV